MMEPTSLENRPIPYKLFDELAMDLDTSWKILARHLGIPETDITSMDNESGLVDVTYIIMLKEWKRIRGDEATVGILQEALEKTGRSDLSEKVEEYIRDRPEQMKTELEKETKMMQKMSLDRADNKNEDKMKRKIHHPSLKVAVPPNSPPLVLPSPLLDAPGATVPGPVAPQHQAPIPKVAPAAAPGPSGTVAGGTAVTSPVVSEGDCRSLIGQMVVGQDVPKLVAPRKQAPSLEAPGPHLPGHDHVPKYNITIGAAGNTVIGHNNTATFRTASTDANTVIGANNTAKFKNAPTDAPLTPASPPEPSGAAGPVPLNQASSPSEEASAALPAGRAVPRYNIKIEGAGNTVVGDYNTATFETASTNAPLTPASPPEPSGAAGPAPLTPASPPEPSGAAGPVSMYNITIGGVHNAVIGNSNTATFGTASTNGLHKV